MLRTVTYLISVGLLLPAGCYSLFKPAPLVSGDGAHSIAGSFSGFISFSEDFSVAATSLAHGLPRYRGEKTDPGEEKPPAPRPRVVNALSSARTGQSSIIRENDNLSRNAVKPHRSKLVVGLGFPRKHTVKAGNTWWTLAESYYGKGWLYPRISAANKGIKFRPGDQLTIPPPPPGTKIAQLPVPAPEARDSLPPAEAPEQISKEILEAIKPLEKTRRALPPRDPADELPQAAEVAPDEETPAEPLQQPPAKEPQIVQVPETDVDESLEAESNSTPPVENHALATQARTVLEKYCHNCHGKNRTKDGNIDFILDSSRLVTKNQVIPNDPDGSELYKKVKRGRMPPKRYKKKPYEGPRPDKAAVDILRRWINSGAPPFVNDIAPPRKLITQKTIFVHVKKDLETVASPVDRRHQRYFTLSHLYSSGATPEEMETGRMGLTKLLNSLSKAPEIAQLKALDAEETILRIDLRDLKWTAVTWEKILQGIREDYPYGILPGIQLTEAVTELTGSRLPIVRADWFVFQASRPPLYHDLLDLPESAQDLEKELKINVDSNIQQARAMRSGFDDSGVSSNNRIIERHDTDWGAYWKSYDFDGETGKNNIFKHPLGPGYDADSFEHAGGEIIYNLPNGLQAYLLVNAAGKRIDQAPVEIVNDPRQNDSTVLNGISCMGCHNEGIIEPTSLDAVRKSVQTAKEDNDESFTDTKYREILALYKDKELLSQKIGEDQGRFSHALLKCGISSDEEEPISTLVSRFEGELSLDLAAAEAGVTPDELTSVIEKNPDMAKALSRLKAVGRISRRVFEIEFSSLQNALGKRVFPDQKPYWNPDGDEEEWYDLVIPAPPFEIRASDVSTGLVMLSQGGKAGIKEGDLFSVSRAGEHIAFVRVFKAFADYSGAEIVGGLSENSVRVQRRDLVKPVPAEKNGRIDKDERDGLRDYLPEIYRRGRSEGRDRDDRLDVKDKVPPPPPRPRLKRTPPVNV